MVPMVVDLARPDLDAPALYRRRFYLNVDQWDGFPQQRNALLRQFDAAGGVVLLSGDIHAGFAAQHTPRTLEFTLPAVSSTTLHEMSSKSAAADADNAAAGMRMVAALESLLMEGDPSLRYVQAQRHGVGIARVDGEAFAMEVSEVPAALCERDRYQDAGDVLAASASVRFVVDAKTRTLRRA